MNAAHVEDAAKQEALAVLGWVSGGDGDDFKSLAILGPGSGFWQHFTQSPEYLNANPNKLDGWSVRTITALAKALNANARFPFTGPPYVPFFDYAKRTGRMTNSPVGMLVHDEQGLFVSFRGALCFEQDLAPKHRRAASPCQTCDTKPCLTACPVDAITELGYDTQTCKTFLQTADGADCISNGCRIRRACPISKGADRIAAQSAYHMRHFLGGRAE